LQADLRDRDRQIVELKREMAVGDSGGGDEITEVGGIRLLLKRVAVGDPEVLRQAADALRDRLGSGVVVLAAQRDGKANLLVAVTSDLVKRVHAGKLVGALAPLIGGRGGGRPDLAQAGGSDVAGIDGALGSAAAALQEQLDARVI
jgi:alanyl-tRNA synthetase